MKRTVALAMVSVVVLMVALLVIAATPSDSVQATASMDVKVSGPGTVRMVVNGLQPNQTVGIVLYAPDNTMMLLGPRQANPQGVIHTTKVLGNAPTPGQWKAEAQANGNVIASAGFAI